MSHSKAKSQCNESRCVLKRLFNCANSPRIVPRCCLRDHPAVPAVGRSARQKINHVANPASLAATSWLEKTPSPLHEPIPRCHGYVNHRPTNACMTHPHRARCAHERLCVSVSVRTCVRARKCRTCERLSIARRGEAWLLLRLGRVLVTRTHAHTRNVSRS